MSDIPPFDETPADLQQLPHSREAEEAVLGAVLINREVFFDLAVFLSADDFYIIRNRWIWEAMIRLSEHRQPLDLLLVADDLEEHSQLEEIGGRAYLISLVNQTPSAMYAVSYGEVVKEMSIRRRMLTAANNLARMAHTRDQSLDTIIGEAEKAIFGLKEDQAQRDIKPIQVVVSAYFDQVDQRSRHDEEIMGVPTGLLDLDRVLGGLQKSDLLIIAGRPGMGKTGFLLSVAKNAALKHKKRVAIFSLEMSNEQLVQRLIAQETGIDTQKMRTGKLDPDEWQLFVHAIEVLGETEIWLDDTPALTPMQLRTKCRRLELEHGLDLVVVDYLQLMSSDTRNDNRVQEVSYISRNLKILARELKVPVLAAAQLSRAVEQRTDKRPILSDLRESGSLEQDADIVMFINRPDALDKDNPRQNVAEIIVAKHRNGPTHPGIELVFRNNLARFDNAETSTLPPAPGRRNR
ncbi:MAG TPA: replicative DNA helicase [Anaerolineaceae bacterium]|jgi:replicative DNA helicase|nr:replicative DNA helicase [Anaerolineaceae bacterium]NMD30770.1 replicative DNA helicase [Chloroflexota bacterium]HNZ00632.1 replicative DNA helicase [Anaerolineaceae bacterium]HOD43962.1 replicative DNA helicase [Anaerolineaceae bacterium]HOH19938.1 replicative DNA helicase [Anaerolineaceae bacterium]